MGQALGSGDPSVMIVYCLVAIIVWLSARLWALGDRKTQNAWTVIVGVPAVTLCGYIALEYGDQDLGPVGAIALGLLTLATGMAVRAWR